MQDNRCQKLHPQWGNKLAVTAGISELRDGSPGPTGGKNTWSHSSEREKVRGRTGEGGWWGGGEMKRRWGKQQRPVRSPSCVTFSALPALLQSGFSYAASFLPAPPLLSASLFRLSGLRGSSGQTELSPDVITASQTERGGDGGEGTREARRLATLKTCQSPREARRDVQKAKAGQTGGQERRKSGSCRAAVEHQTGARLAAKSAKIFRESKVNTRGEVRETC